MSSTMHILIILLISVIGFFGIFLGLIPDIAPSFISIIPSFQKMDTGLKALNNFRTMQIGGEEQLVGTLGHGENGYDEILALLESFDPIIRSLKTSNLKLRIKILGVQDKRLTWSGIHLFEGIWIEIGGKYKIVCLMPDLKFMVKDAKTRFFSRLGFGFTLASLLFQGGYAIFNVAIGLLAPRPGSHKKFLKMNQQPPKKP